MYFFSLVLCAYEMTEYFYSVAKPYCSLEAKDYLHTKFLSTTKTKTKFRSVRNFSSR